MASPITNAPAVVLSVWSSVAALVKAASSALPGDAKIGVAAHSMITGGNVSFSGASGKVSFSSNGDRNPATKVAFLQNYVHDPSAPRTPATNPNQWEVP